MSSPERPEFNRRTSSKRKRSFAGAESDDNDFPSSLPSHLSRDSINPLSHSPNLLFQFRVAGLSETDVNPTEEVSDFPHRAPGRQYSHENVESDDTEVDQEQKKKTAATATNKSFKDPHFETLLQSVHQFLDQGEIEKASRAYGLLLQLRPHGLPVDLRHHNLWAIGAEIVMRQGERTTASRETTAAASAVGGGGGGGKSKRRWGSAANMNKLKAYFDTLIQQYPWDHKRPQAIGALDFWLAVYNCEVYNTHVEHAMALDRLEHEDNDWDDDTDFIHDTFGVDEHAYQKEVPDSRDVKLLQHKEKLRLQALASMKDITTRMDSLMQNVPYSKNTHFLRLRATAALYLADLAEPLLPSGPLVIEEARRHRHTETQIARRALRKVLDDGSTLDAPSQAILQAEDEDEDDSTMSLNASLPIRGL